LVVVADVGSRAAVVAALAGILGHGPDAEDGARLNDGRIEVQAGKQRGRANACACWPGSS
jgi:hypothetical protein